jgi:hypothetical protein
VKFGLFGFVLHNHSYLVKRESYVEVSGDDVFFKRHSQLYIKSLFTDNSRELGKDQINKSDAKSREQKRERAHRISERRKRDKKSQRKTKSQKGVLLWLRAEDLH